MSSKKWIYFLTISLICGLMMGGVAHAQIDGVKGTVSYADGTPVVGATVEAVSSFGDIPVKPITDETGAYNLPYISFANVPIQAGDEITLKVTTAEGEEVQKTHAVTAADVSAGEATFNITFVSTTVTVTVAPSTFKADTPGTGTVTATVDLEGAGDR